MNRFIMTTGVAVSCLAFSAVAQDPALITSRGSMGMANLSDDFVYPSAVLMDQLYHVDRQAYNAANGNTWGGYAIFGVDYDLQLCDDMNVGAPFEITDVTIDNLGFIGNRPAQMRIGVFADAGGFPSDSYTYDGDWPITGASSFTDTIFGLIGLRTTASGLSNCISPGHYWVMGQVATAQAVGGDGDWWYSCRGNQDNGGDSYGRDGDRGNPGYGVPNWTAMGALGFGNGDTSMRVLGNLECGGCPNPLMDQTDIANSQSYIAGNGNAWGGYNVFGVDLDLQLCDDMRIPHDFVITDVTNDSVTFFGGPPAQMRIGVFADAGGSPSDAYLYDADWGVSNFSNWTDTLFGLIGSRTTASGRSRCIPAGRYWVMGQPATAAAVGGDGDWHYTVRDGGGRGGDSYLRDGDRGDPGYGWNTWVSGGGSGFGAGDASMQVCGNRADCFHLSTNDQCPGFMTFTVCGAQPGDLCAIAYSFTLGNWVVPGGPCAGTQLGIVNPTVAGIGPADGSGCFSVSGNVPPAACGRVHIQAVNVSNGCQTSNVLSI